LNLALKAYLPLRDFWRESVPLLSEMNKRRVVYLIKYLNEKEDEQNKNKKLRTYQRRLSGERWLD